MPLIPLAIPPGVYRNGTEYQGAGRWREASLVRWYEGSMRPVGGWESRITVTDKAPRGALAWSDLSGDARFAVGTYEKLFSVSSGGVVTDITPAGLTVGLLDAAVNTGYGGGFYGVGFYGTARPDTGNYSEATTWSLDNWGEYLLACSSADGKIYQWDLNPANDGVALSGAPVDNKAVMVTDERFVFALGAGGNPRKVQWCDRENNTDWTPTTTNEAGDLELQAAGQIMCGARVRGQSLILTDIDAHVATYQGPPFVYGFQRVGTSCGSVSRKALAVVDAGAFWMSTRGFFAYAGDTVSQLSSDVGGYVFSNLNRAQQSKIFAVACAQFGEVWWFYPSEGSNECDSYVAYSYRENHWATGVLGRTAGIDRGVFRWPIYFDSTGIAYNHEIGFNHDSLPTYAETGPTQIGNGDQVYHVTSLFPDEQTQGDVSITFKTRFYPNGDQRSYGPYAANAPTSCRFAGRQVNMRVDAVRNADWRVGIMRIEAKAGGLR